MKKVSIYLSVLGLTLLMFIGIDLNEASATTAQSHQLNNASERENEVANTRYIEIERVLSPLLPIPGFYSYSSNGWRGTLEIISTTVRSDGYILATYGGTVSCSGNCPIGE